MLPKRALLYHRGVDDHIGTYVSDYAFAGVSFLLTVWLLMRVRRQRSKGGKLVPRCSGTSAWALWNWPGPEVTPVSMTTYALVVFGFSSTVMTLLGGLTHQFLQHVEPYKTIEDSRNWLILWRIGASFSAPAFLALLTMTEQLIVQESVIQIPRKIRICYYVTIYIVTLGLLVYNFTPLSGTEDPFNIGPTFLAYFAAMLVYAVTVSFVLTRTVCFSNSSQNQSERKRSNSCDNQIGNQRSLITENRQCRRHLISCCKKVAVRCHDNDVDNDVTDRRWDLMLNAISFWILLLGGLVNFLLKKVCSDSDHAHEELGCPLPDVFNHNALMHVIQMIAFFPLFQSENLAITRRSKISDVISDRSVTSSRLSNDEMKRKSSTSVNSSLLTQKNNNNNLVDNHCDVIQIVTSQHEAENEIMVEDDRNHNEGFSISDEYDITSDEKRFSVYDNVSGHNCDFV